MSGETVESSEYLQGRAEMKAEIVAALGQALARDTGYDQHERDEGCSQCVTWYRAIDAAESCEV